MNRYIELGINPAEEAREQEREIMDQAAAERMELLGGLAGRVQNTVTGKILPAGKKALFLGIKHNWGTGALVEGVELYKNKNFLTGQALSKKEKVLRYVGVSFELTAFALFIYALQQKEGQQIWQDLQGAFDDAAKLHFAKLFRALDEVISNPHAGMAMASEGVSAVAGKLQEVVTAGQVCKKWGDKLHLPEAGEFLSKAYNMAAPKLFTYEK